MRNLKFLMILASLIGIVSCDKNDLPKNHDAEVWKYIEALKSNNYDHPALPAFTEKQIPGLLQYIHEKQIIASFPTNPISSLHVPESSLGMYVLWTIESIRARSTGNDQMIMGFPSQNPLLARKNAEGLAIVADSESHNIAAKAYADWWENNKHQEFQAFHQIDPLGDTPYKWH